LNPIGGPSDGEGAPCVVRRAAEFVLLFFGLPLVFTFELFPGARRWFIAALVLVAMGCLVALLRDRRFERRQLWNAAGFGRRAVPVLLRFLVIGAALTAAVLLFKPKLFLGFPRRNALAWAIVMILYPVLSVYPQELIFRAFLFRRYRALFPRPWQMIAASAVCFSFAHIVFGNWVAVAITLPGGVIFAWTYHRTRSLLVASFEHALYGDLIFTVGIGYYLYHGSRRLAELVTS